MEEEQKIEEENLEEEQIETEETEEEPKSETDILKENINNWVISGGDIFKGILATMTDKFISDLSERVEAKIEEVSGKFDEVISKMEEKMSGDMENMKGESDKKMEKLKDTIIEEIIKEIK